MKKKINFNIEVPQYEKNKKESNGIKNSHIKSLKDIIKKQYDEVYKNQEVEITEYNKEEIEDLIFATKDLIDNCIKDLYYNGNKDESFINLIYIYHRLDLKYETYKLMLKINELDNKSIEIQNIQDKINERQNKTEEQSSNLVYNLLGFLTAFSIVSAVVGVVSQINGVINIMIFMAFTILLLLTTLIGLHNFYENRNKRQNKLQDNYFLWKTVAIICIILIIALGIKAIYNKKDKICNYLDNKIEKIIEEKVIEKGNM